VNQWSALEKVMGCSDQRRGCNGLVWMSWTSRLSMWYLLLLELLSRTPMIMLIDLLACWNGLLGLLVSGGGGRSHSSRQSSGCWLSHRRSSRRLVPHDHVVRRGGCCCSDARMTGPRHF
jgi:hypothetical protein